MSEQQNVFDKELIQMLEANGEFKISPFENTLELQDKNRFTKLELGMEQKMHISSFMQQLPAVVSVGMISQAYAVKFPAGLPHTLTALKQGGFGSMLRENGKFVGTASFYPMSFQALVLGAFTAMSIASSQYFLTQINNKMKMMNLKLDKILEFLYGDKKAELMAEMSFIHYAYENYPSLMLHDHQRTATIASLQEARKIAMKDIEFYIYDLESTVSREAKDYKEISSIVEKSFQIKESLEFSQQLYIMSSIMEVYFAQNQDAKYLDFVEQDIFAYIDKCGKRILGSFSVLKGKIGAYKPKRMEKIDKSAEEKRVSAVIASLNNETNSSVRTAVHTALQAAAKETEYYLDKDGEIYTKV